MRKFIYPARGILSAALTAVIALGPGVVPCAAQRVRVPAAVPAAVNASRFSGIPTRPLSLKAQTERTLLAAPKVFSAIPAATPLPPTPLASVSPPVAVFPDVSLPTVINEISTRGELVGRTLEDAKEGRAGSEQLSEDARRLIEGAGKTPSVSVNGPAASVEERGSHGFSWGLQVHGLHAPDVRGAGVGVPGKSGSEQEDRVKKYTRALKWALGIGALFAAIEFAGGLATGSLSLKADAMHLTADLAVTAMALLSIWMTRKPPSAKRSFGNLKMEALTGLLSSVGISALSLYTFSEAVARLWAPMPLPGAVTIALAFAGLAANAASAFLLYKHRHANLTLKGAFLHAAIDALGSVAIIAGSVLMLAFGWYVVDPILSLVISGLIAKTVWVLGRSSWNILMDSVPEGMNLKEVEAALAGLPGVARVSQLRLWSLDSNTPALTVHLETDQGASIGNVLKAARLLVEEKFKISQATIQVDESGMISRYPGWTP